MSAEDHFHSAAVNVGGNRFPGGIPAPHPPDVRYTICELRELNKKRKHCHLYTLHS